MALKGLSENQRNVTRLIGSRLWSCLDINHYHKAHARCLFFHLERIVGAGNEMKTHAANENLANGKHLEPQEN